MKTILGISAFYHDSAAAIILPSPLDAFNCFIGTDLDRLVISNFYLDKNNQNPALKKDYTKEFELD